MSPPRGATAGRSGSSGGAAGSRSQSSPSTACGSPAAHKMALHVVRAVATGTVARDSVWLNVKWSDNYELG